MEGLIVKQPFADLIINGDKTWELRSRSAPKQKINKEILLLSSGFALGKVKITKCFEASKTELIANSEKHQCALDASIENYYSHVWEMNVIKKFQTPKKYHHLMGARVWIKNVDYKKQSKLLQFI